jgi:putative Mn2+ efflux pump MntP
MYMLYLTQRFGDEGAVMDARWMLFGLPLALSLDNLVAGIGLGVGSHPIFFAALTIDAISGLMALVVWKLGNVVGRYSPVRSDLLGGVTLVFVAVTLALYLG